MYTHTLHIAPPPPIILWLPPAGGRRINILAEACRTPHAVWCGAVCFFTLWVIQTMWPHFREWYTRAQSVNTAFVRLIWRSAMESKPLHVCGFKHAFHIACGAKGNGHVKVLSGSPWGKRWRRATCMLHPHEAMSVTVSLRSFLPPYNLCCIRYLSIAWFVKQCLQQFLHISGSVCALWECASEVGGGAGNFPLLAAVAAAAGSCASTPIQLSALLGSASPSCPLRSALRLGGVGPVREEEKKKDAGGG